MGDMQLGSGSEWHLLRMLGRHRTYFDRLIAERIRADKGGEIGNIEWLDFPFDRNHVLHDGEQLAVDFVGKDVFQQWELFWPDRRPGQLNRKGQLSWDAVGRGRGEWLLVEAKANETEFNKNTPCGAGAKSRLAIIAAMHDTLQAMGLTARSWETCEDVWLGDLYQSANRLACLHFIRNVLRRPARLVLIYFVGDRPGIASHRVCPTSEGRWHELIAAAHNRLGVPECHPLAPFIHRLCRRGER